MSQMNMDTKAAKVEAPNWNRILTQAAWISGIFSVLITVILLVSHFYSLRLDPNTSPELAAMKLELLKHPQDQALKEKIRDLDLRLRQVHARHLALTERGAWILLASVAVFLICIKSVTFRKRLPRPPRTRKSAEDEEREIRQTSLATALVGLGLVVVAWVVMVRTDSRLSMQQLALAPEVVGAGPNAGSPASTTPESPAPKPAPAPAPAPVTEADLRANWHRFRGFQGNGRAPEAHPPVQWDPASGQNVLWKTPLPMPGFNSPIVWEGRVFFSGGDKEARGVFCVDADTGQLLWQNRVAVAPPAALVDLELEDEPGYAAPTMATDGRRVYAMFATGEVVAYDLDGNLKWSKHLGVPENTYGHAASLEIFQDRLLVQMDQGHGDSPPSRIYAFDGPTGEAVWEKARPVPSSWASPIVIYPEAGPQVIALGDPWVISYDPQNGDELWRADLLAGEIAPSPIFVDGLVLVTSPYDRLAAIRPGGSGDVTETHVAWEGMDGIQDITTSVATENFVVNLDTSGLLTCLSMQDGSMVWEEELDLECKSSPSIAGDYCFIFSVEGTVVIFQPGEKYQETGRLEMGEAVLASPAFLGGRIYIKGVENLYAIEEVSHSG